MPVVKRNPGAIVWSALAAGLLCSFFAGCNSSPTEPNGNGRFSPTPTPSYTPMGSTPITATPTSAPATPTPTAPATATPLTPVPTGTPFAGTPTPTHP